MMSKIKKNTTENFINRLNQAEKRINKFKERSFETIQRRKNKQRNKKIKEYLQSLWDAFKRINKHFMGVPMEKIKENTYLKK